jgi:putative addiction module CopG family antidote
MAPTTANLPADLQQFVEAKVRSGRFSSPDEAITAAVRLLRQQEEAQEAHVLEGIPQRVEHMRAACGRPAGKVFADIRREFDVSPDA